LDIVVASSGKATCPVAMMSRYLGRAGLSCDSPLFCQLSKTKCGYKPKSKGLSNSRLRELMLEAFKDIVPDISAIGTHSLRTGGACTNSRKELRRNCSPIGHNRTKHFCTQSGGGIRLNFWK